MGSLLYVTITSPPKIKTMKTKSKLSIIAMLMVVLMGSCQTEEMQDPSLQSKANAKTAITEPLQHRVSLRQAGGFVILSKSGISDVPSSAVTGNIGTSPITGAAIHLTCAEVTGLIYTVDAAGPACRITNASKLTTAVSDMQTAYNDAAGRQNPNFLNVGAGNIGGLTLRPGLHKWTSAVVMPTDVVLKGGPNDVWIFQINGTLGVSNGARIILAGGAQPKNIFWQTTGAVTLGTTSHFEGVILSATGINMQTGGTINGRLYAQTAVTLQMNTVTMPTN